jgi:hypothetical protein
MDSFEQRLNHLEQKVGFVMQTLSLTRRKPDGQTDARSLTALFEEMHNHAGTDPQTFAQVAQRAFTPEGTGSQPSRPQSADGPDGFPREDGNDTDSTTR